MTATQDKKTVRLPDWFQWATGGFGASLISIGIWVGTIQANQSELMEYKKMSEPTRVEAIKTLEAINVTLKNIESDVKRIENKQDAHIRDFTEYKDQTARNIQEFYRRNPDL